MVIFDQFGIIMDMLNELRSFRKALLRPYFLVWMARLGFFRRNFRNKALVILDMPRQVMKHREPRFPRETVWKQPIWGLLVQINLGGGFKYVLFSPLFGEESHFY